jgi:hypothetical protein
MGNLLRNIIAAILANLLCAALARATEKPPVSPDQTAPNTVPSHISASLEFNLRDVAQVLDRAIPHRLANFSDRRIGCVHRHVLGLVVNADCTISGWVERTSGLSLAADGGKIVGSLPLRGSVVGQGASGITRAIRGHAEGRMVVYGEARPQLRSDWSLALNFSDDFRWTERPILHVLGLEIDMTQRVEPRIREELARVNAVAQEKARALDLRGKAAIAWRHAFDPIKLVDEPPLWLQMKPETIDFAGVHGSNGKAMEGTLEITGTAATIIGHEPPAATPIPLPPLGHAVSEPGHFEVIIPVQIDYEMIRRTLQDVLTRLSEKSQVLVRAVQIYPSGGRLIIGLHLESAPQAVHPSEGWLYLSAMPRVDGNNAIIELVDPAISVEASETPARALSQLLGSDKIIDAIRERLRVSYRASYDKLLATANSRLTRPLVNGFRMEGKLTDASVDKLSLLAEGLSLQLRAQGTLKIAYGM